MNIKFSLSTNGIHTVEVSTDNTEETDTALGIANTYLTELGSLHGTDTSTIVPPPVTSVPICGVHNVPMGWKAPGISSKNGKAYPGFYSCKILGPNNEYCSYKLPR